MTTVCVLRLRNVVESYGGGAWLVCRKEKITCKVIWVLWVLPSVVGNEKGCVFEEMPWV